MSLEDDLQRRPNTEEIIAGFTEGTDYMHSFSLQEEFATTLQGYNHQTGKVEKETVKADWNTVDIWTWSRLQKEWAEFESNYKW